MDQRELALKFIQQAEMQCPNSPSVREELDLIRKDIEGTNIPSHSKHEKLKEPEDDKQTTSEDGVEDVASAPADKLKEPEDTKRTTSEDGIEVIASAPADKLKEPEDAKQMTSEDGIEVTASAPAALLKTPDVQQTDLALTAADKADCYSPHLNKTTSDTQRDRINQQNQRKHHLNVDVKYTKRTRDKEEVICAILACLNSGKGGEVTLNNKTTKHGTECEDLDREIDGYFGIDQLNQTDNYQIEGIYTDLTRNVLVKPIKQEYLLYRSHAYKRLGSITVEVHRTKDLLEILSQESQEMPALSHEFRLNDNLITEMTEGRKIEFKEVTATRLLKFMDRYGRYVSSFANTIGGCILYGITDNGRVKGVEGVEDKKKIHDTFAEKINDMYWFQYDQGRIDPVEGEHWILEFKEVIGAPQGQELYVIILKVNRLDKGLVFSQQPQCPVLDENTNNGYRMMTFKEWCTYLGTLYSGFTYRWMKLLTMDNFVRSHEAVQVACSAILPSVKKVVEDWHQHMVKSLKPCATPRTCPATGKPTVRKGSCQECVNWGLEIEKVHYPPQKVKPNQWANINPTLLCKDPIEVAKAFVFRLPQGHVYKDFGNFDVGNILMIMMHFNEFHHGDQTMYTNIKKVSAIRSNLSHMKIEDNFLLEEPTMTQTLCEVTDLIRSLHPDHLSIQGVHELEAQIKQIQSSPITSAMQSAAICPFPEAMKQMVRTSNDSRDGS